MIGRPLCHRCRARCGNPANWAGWCDRCAAARDHRLDRRGLLDLPKRDEDQLWSERAKIR